MWVMRASVIYIQYLSNIFIAILENQTTQNKDEGFGHSFQQADGFGV